MGIKVSVFEKGPLDENTYLIVDENTGYAAIVDPGYFGKDIEDLIGSKENLKYILLTHAHGDHIFMLHEYLDKYPEVEVVANKKEAVLLEDCKLNGSLQMMGKDISYKSATYVNDQESIMLGESEISFISTPGHSIGGMCYLVDNKLFTGDTLFYRSVGATHFPTGDWDELQKSIRKKLYVLPGDIVVYPGHGPMTKIAEEKENNPFV